MTPDEICVAFFDTGCKITIKDLDELVLIEGNSTALEFLANLILAQVRCKKDCGFEISPTGPGNALFSADSNRGLYIHLTHEGDEP